MANKSISELMQDNLELNPNLGNPGGQKERLDKLLRAKSGKARSAGTGPRSSNIQEQVAAQQVEAAKTDLSTQAAMQTQAIQQQEEQLDEQARLAQETSIEQSKAAKAQFDRMMLEIENTLKHNFKKLKMRERQEVFQAAVTMARLANKKYIHDLQDRAKRERIDSEAAWKKKFAETQAADSMAFFRNNLIRANILFEEKYAFREMMDDMSIEQAMELGEWQQDAASAQQMAGGLGQAVSGVSRVYAASGDDTATSPQSPQGIHDTGYSEADEAYISEYQAESDYYENLLAEED